MPRISHSIAALAFLVCAWTASPTAFAQQPSAATADALISLEFAGGTAADYIAALRKADPSANIVVLGNLAAIEMQGVQLKNVDVLSALRVLDQLPTEQGSILAKVRVEDVRSNQDVPAVYAVTAEVHPRSGRPDSQQTTVISMADLLGENLKPADALTAIQTALELIAGDSDPAQIKFHEETGLLIARGSAEQIESIRQVNTQLRERANVIDQRASSQQAEARAQERTQSGAQARADAAAAQQQLTEWKVRAEIMEAAMVDLRQQMATIQDELRATAAERDQLQRMVADLTDRLKGAKP